LFLWRWHSIIALTTIALHKRKGYWESRSYSTRSTSRHDLDLPYRTVPCTMSPLSFSFSPLLVHLLPGTTAKIYSRKVSKTWCNTETDKQSAIQSTAAVSHQLAKNVLP